jgi:threonine synthase
MEARSHLMQLIALSAATWTQAQCRTRYAIDEVLYTCPKCGGLLEVTYGPLEKEPDELKRIWRQRRCDNAAIEQSGVWRYRELISFIDDPATSSRFVKGTRRCFRVPARRNTADSTGLRSSTRASTRRARSKTTE